MPLKQKVYIRGIGLIRLRIGIIKSPCECGIEPPGSICHRVSWLVCFILVIKVSIKILVLWYKHVTADWLCIFLGRKENFYVIVHLVNEFFIVSLT